VVATRDDAMYSQANTRQLALVESCGSNSTLSNPQVEAMQGRFQVACTVGRWAQSVRLEDT